MIKCHMSLVWQITCTYDHKVASTSSICLSPLHLCFLVLCSSWPLPLGVPSSLADLCCLFVLAADQEGRFWQGPSLDRFWLHNTFFLRWLIAISSWHLGKNILHGQQLPHEGQVHISSKNKKMEKVRWDSGKSAGTVDSRSLRRTASRAVVAWVELRSSMSWAGLTKSVMSFWAGLGWLQLPGGAAYLCCIVAQGLLVASKLCTKNCLRHMVLELHAAPQGRLQDGQKGRDGGGNWQLGQVEVESVHILT